MARFSKLSVPAASSPNCLITHEGHLKYELDLELIAYGRDYAGKQVGPYARLFVYEPGEGILHEGQWRGNTFHILVAGRLDVYIEGDRKVSKNVGEIESQNSFNEMSLLSGQPAPAETSLLR